MLQSPLEKEKEKEEVRHLIPLNKLESCKVVRQECNP